MQGDDMKNIYCGNANCHKKLLEIGAFDRLSVKCPRCKQITTLSVMNALPERHERPHKDTHGAHFMP